jgi:hypothetical protein
LNKPQTFLDLLFSMILKEKQIAEVETSQVTPVRVKSWACFFLSAVFLLFASGAYSSGTNPEEEVFQEENAKVVFSTGDNNKVVISSGKITATGGQSIRLLPGTHIEQGVNMVIDISDKKCQDLVAEEVARENEQEMLAAVVEKQKEELIPAPINHNTLFCTGAPLPEPDKTFGQQAQNAAALTVNPTISFSAPSTTVNSKTTLLDIHNLMAMAFNNNYTPTLSWGELAGTIKVQRC